MVTLPVFAVDGDMPEIDGQRAVDDGGGREGQRELASVSGAHVGATHGVRTAAPPGGQGGQIRGHRE
jgi:hypothetical protein